MLFVISAMAGTLLDPAGEAALMDLLEVQLRASEALAAAAALALHQLPLDGPRCRTPGDGHALRSVRFDAAWQTQHEVVAATADRLREAVAMPTLVPLRSLPRSQAQRALLARVERDAAARKGFGHAVKRAQRQVARCPTVLQRAPGTSWQGTLAADDPVPLTAVWVVDAGWMCGMDVAPREVPAGPVLLSTPRCWDADRTCGCEPSEVAPGAVL